METGENNLKVVREIPRQNFQIIPSNFNQETASVCLLCFEISENRLNFSLVNKSKARYDGLGSFTFKEESITPPILKSFLASDELFKNDFAQIIYVERNRNYAIIPSAFYLPEKHNSYLQASSFFNEGFGSSQNQNKTFDVINAGQLNTELKKTVIDFFAKGRAFHHVDVLLEMAAMLQSIDGEPQVILNVQGSFFDLIIAENKALKLANSYYFEGAEDVLYYTLLAFDQIGLNNQKTKVLVMGQQASNSALYHLLDKYLANWKTFDESPFLGVSNQINAQLVANYFLTLNSFLCA